MAKPSSSTIIDNVKRIVQLPDNQGTFDDNGILKLADRELLGYIMPKIKQIREGFYIRQKLIPIVSGQSKYLIPRRAIGGSLKEINEYDGAKLRRPIPQFDLGQIDDNIGGRVGFTVQGPYIVLNSVPGEDGYNYLKYLEMSYFLRPNNLVVPSDCAQIQSINTSNNSVMVGAIPSSMVGGSIVDVISNGGLSPILAQDISIQSASSFTIILSELPDDLFVGDYVALSEETPVAQMPEEFYPLLEQRIACKILEGQGYLPKLAAAQKKADELANEIWPTIVPRIVAKEPIIPNSWEDDWIY